MVSEMRKAHSQDELSIIGDIQFRRSRDACAFPQGRGERLPAQAVQYRGVLLRGWIRTSICCASSGRAGCSQPGFLTGLHNRRFFRVGRSDVPACHEGRTADRRGDDRRGSFQSSESTTPSATRSAMMRWLRSLRPCAIWSGQWAGRSLWWRGVRACTCSTKRSIPANASTRSGWVSPPLSCTAMVNALASPPVSAPPAHFHGNLIRCWRRPTAPSTQRKRPVATGWRSTDTEPAVGRILSAAGQSRASSDAVCVAEVLGNRLR